MEELRGTHIFIIYNENLTSKNLLQGSNFPSGLKESVYCSQLIVDLKKNYFLKTFFGIISVL